MKPTLPKTQCYDLLKVLTQILVVIGHVTRMYVGDGAFSPADSSEGLRQLCLYIYGFHMPLFMLLAGAVFGIGAEQGKYRRLLPFIVTKIKRVIIPYLFFGCCYVMPVMVYTGLCHDWRDFIVRCILLGGNSRHLWYLLALFWVFVLAGLIRPLLFKRPLPVIVCSLLLCFLSPRWSLRFQWTNAMYYQFFFICGIYINRWFDRIAAALRRFRWWTLIFPVAAAGVLWNAGWPWKPLWACCGIAAMLSLAVNMPQWGEKLQQTRFYIWSRQNNFGIYLFHPMIIYVVFFWLGQRSCPPLLISVLLTAVSYILSGCATSLLRKLGLGILIGER